jgi:hypothetical protein
MWSNGFGGCSEPSPRLVRTCSLDILTGVCIARLYERRFPAEVAALVLVDSTPEQWPRPAVGRPNRAVMMKYCVARWTELPRELGKCSARGDHRIALNSGHNIQLTAPQLIVDAVARLIHARRPLTS